MKSSVLIANCIDFDGVEKVYWRDCTSASAMSGVARKLGHALVGIVMKASTLRAMHGFADNTASKHGAPASAASS